MFWFCAGVWSSGWTALWIYSLCVMSEKGLITTTCLLILTAIVLTRLRADEIWKGKNT